MGWVCWFEFLFKSYISSSASYLKGIKGTLRFFSLWDLHSNQKLMIKLKKRKEKEKLLFFKRPNSLNCLCQASSSLKVVLTEPQFNWESHLNNSVANAWSELVRIEQCSTFEKSYTQLSWLFLAIFHRTIQEVFLVTWLKPYQLAHGNMALAPLLCCFLVHNACL